MSIPTPVFFHPSNLPGPLTNRNFFSILVTNSLSYSGYHNVLSPSPRSTSESIFPQYHTAGSHVM